MASIFTSGVFEGFDSNGDPLAGGKLYTYAAGTTTPLASYTNQGGGTPNANPVVLDSAGRANVWLGSSAYRLLLKTSAGVTVWDTDNVRSDAFESAALSASTGSSLVGHIASGTGAVATTVQAKLRERVSVFDFMTAAQIAAVRAGTSLSGITAAIQAAFDSLGGTYGGEVYFPAGKYVLVANIYQFGKSNITVVGSGMGKTIIDGSTIAITTNTNNPNYLGSSGVLGFASTGNGLKISDITVCDLTILNASGATSDHSMTFANVDNITVQRVEFDTSYWETLYLGAGSTDYPKNLRVLDCNFTNIQFTSATGAIDTNTRNYDGVLIEGNTFDSVYFGIALLGKNLKVTNNTFRDISGKGIAIGESNYDDDKSLASAVVSGNTFYGLGKNPLRTPVVGIDIITRSKLYSNGTQDFGVLVADNTFTNSIATNPITMIRTTGPLSASGNYASGIDSGTNVYTTFFYYDGKYEPTTLTGSIDPTASTAVVGVGTLFTTELAVGDQITVSGETRRVVAIADALNLTVDTAFTDTANDTAPQKVNPVCIYLTDNVLQKTHGSISFGYGIGIAKTDHTYVYMSGNRISVKSNGNSGLYTTNGTYGSAGNVPNIFLSGDIINGQLGINVGYGLNTLGELNNVPLYGGTAQVTTNVSKGLGIPGLGASTTPSVKNHSFVQESLAGATTVTNFLDGQVGQEITILCQDSNMTINDSGSFKLSAAFTSTAGDILKLIYDGTYWIEVSRSVN